MPVPTINVVDGSVSNGPLVHGQPFAWYNPTASAVTLSNCGNFCTQDSYTVPANGYAQAGILQTPNQFALAFTDPAWNAPGMPHIQNPIQFFGHDRKDGPEKVA